MSKSDSDIESPKSKVFLDEHTEDMYSSLKQKRRVQKREYRWKRNRCKRDIAECQDMLDEYHRKGKWCSSSTQSAIGDNYSVMHDHVWSDLPTFARLYEDAPSYDKEHYAFLSAMRWMLRGHWEGETRQLTLIKPEAHGDLVVPNIVRIKSSLNGEGAIEFCNAAIQEDWKRILASMPDISISHGVTDYEESKSMLYATGPDVLDRKDPCNRLIMDFVSRPNNFKGEAGISAEGGEKTNTFSVHWIRISL